LSDPETVKLLTTRFVCIGQNAQENRPTLGRFKDDIEFYNRFGGRLEDRFAVRDGFVILTVEGDMLVKGRRMGYTRDDLRDWLKDGLREFEKRLQAGYVPKYVPSAGAEEKPVRYKPPEGAVVLMMRNKILGYDAQAINGLYSRPGGNPKLSFAREYMESPGQMFRLLRKDEAAALVKGSLPATVKLLIASSLMDPVQENRLLIKPRGNLDWHPGDLKKVEMRLADGRLTGSIRLEKTIREGENRGQGSYEGEILGLVEAKDGRLTRFDVVVKGHGVDAFAPRPPNRVVPTGKFPMAFAFSIVDKPEDLAKIPFQSVFADPAARDPNIPTPLHWDLKRVPAGVVK
jgi:hypothetical protein